ncbi:MAG: exodeoxyribonuclease VII large subunit [Rhabdochlamydiaceae bacterium]|jgi:exodeoxyribonuclease VII large subunit
MQEILSVSELTSTIKKYLESRFPALSVKGEISNFKEQSSGHLYFTLKDQESQISCVLFRGNARDLKRTPKNGDQVVVHGEMNLYPPRGYYQIVVRTLDYFGVGELLMQLQALKAKLEKQGWFDASRKKPLPKFPRTIGVVTSPTGSVIQDILHVLSRRFAGFHLILNPVKVQGEGAAAEIAQAIERFNHYALADVLIVGRGGGSLEDLWAFNEEKVAAAIFNSKIPIISAIGHETDFSIADFVADLRAPTPSAAAEIATLETSQHLHQLTQMKSRLKSIVLISLQHHRKQLENFKRHPSIALPLSLLEPHLQRIDDLRSDLHLYLKRNLQEKQLQLLALKKQALTLKPSHQILGLKQKLNMFVKSIDASMLQQLSGWKKSCDRTLLRKNLDQRMGEQIDQKAHKLAQLSSHLRGIDPKNLLTRGYCILFQEKKDSVILSTQELKEQDKVRLQLHNGKIHLTVTGIES